MGLWVSCTIQLKLNRTLVDRGWTPSYRLSSGLLCMSLILLGPVVNQGIWPVPGDSLLDPEGRSRSYMGHVLVMADYCGMRRHVQLSKHISKLLVSDLQVFYWPKQVTWPNTKSKGVKVISVHHGKGVGE